jgi:hypothetical protein
VDGILGHNLLLSRAFVHNLFFFMVEFWVSESLSHELFLFSMGFWLSESLSHELFSFSRWNSGYQGAFLTNFFLFHDGILAIREPFSRTFFFFTMEF